MFVRKINSFLSNVTTRLYKEVDKASIKQQSKHMAIQELNNLGYSISELFRCAILHAHLIING